MANMCYNEFYANSDNENNLKIISEFLKYNFNADISESECTIDAYFHSKWTFPEELMEELFNSIPDKEDLYMRCLSVEYGCMYHALWYCDEDGWHES